MEFDVSQVLNATEATLISDAQGIQMAHGISTDTRTLKAGELFFCLKGPHFDGHDFASEALKKGAWGVVVSGQQSAVSNQLSAISSQLKDVAVFQVKDTLKALGDLAAWWRSRFSIPCVAITGSNGKTTTKEMIASILQQNWKVLKTEGNFNNLIGLPLTLGHLNETHQALVLEMGMNAAGEIRRLTEIARPTVGLVLNVAKAHLEKLHTVEAVAHAKAELYEGLSESAIAIYNAEDPWLAKLVAPFKGRKISFGMQESADVLFEHMETNSFNSMDLVFSVGGKSLQVALQTSGVHNVMNAMAAAAVAKGLGLPLSMIEEGLRKFKPLKMRFEQIQLANGVRLVNDAYNANPFSMEAAFRAVGVAQRAGRFFALLGDMKELGEESEKLHEELGAKAKKYNVDQLFLIGEFSKMVERGALKEGFSKDQVLVFQNEEECLKHLVKIIKGGDILLVKGSRAMHLETIVEELKERFGG